MFNLLAESTAPVQWFGSDFVTALLFLIAAFILVFLEMLIVSFGVLTLLAVLAGGLAIMSAFASSNVVGWAFVAFAIIGVPIIIALSLRILKDTSMVLSEDCGDAGSTGEADQLTVGARGKTISALRPSGNCLIDGQKISVQSMGEIIENDVDVEVISISGNRVVVKGV